MKDTLIDALVTIRTTVEVWRAALAEVDLGGVSGGCQGNETDGDRAHEEEDEVVAGESGVRGGVVNSGPLPNGHQLCRRIMSSVVTGCEHKGQHAAYVHLRIMH